MHNKRHFVKRNDFAETALLEKEFAAYMGSRYCLACASCGPSSRFWMTSA
ncbi:MAG: hypothetical protein U5K27_14010 [Desulfotignum sp.]|nr:hypothetical protein [Desulfotignum sp.]